MSSGEIHSLQNQQGNIKQIFISANGRVLHELQALKWAVGLSLPKDKAGKSHSSERTEKLWPHYFTMIKVTPGSLVG